MGKPITNRDVQIREEWRSIWEAGKSRIPQDLMPALELVGQRLGIKPATVRISLLKLREDPYPIGRPKAFRRRKRKVKLVPGKPALCKVIGSSDDPTIDTMITTNSPTRHPSQEPTQENLSLEGTTDAIVKHQLGRLTEIYRDIDFQERKVTSLKVDLKLCLETLKGLI